MLAWTQQNTMQRAMWTVLEWPQSHAILKRSVPIHSAKTAFRCKNIRILNGCEVRIENSVMRVTVRHHEACLVMPNSYPE